MTTLQQKSLDTTRLRQLSEVLIPSDGNMPCASEIEDLNKWLERAIRSCGYSAQDQRAALDALPDDINWENVKAFSVSNLASFAILSTLVSAAYYMSPPVLAKLGYPEDRRNPADAEEFLQEYETGVFDKMMSRAPHYRRVS